MKKVLLPFSLLFFAVILINAQNFKHIIAPSVTYLDNVKLNVKIQPGDTICIQSSTRRSLNFVNVHGTQEKPVIVINYGGEVIIQGVDLRWGIAFNNCSFMHFTGTGSPEIKYGFRILKTMEGGTSGISGNGKSTNIEIDHFEIANVGFAGIFFKSDPVCDLSANRGNFIQYQTIIHDNYIHNTGGEGLYIGHSFYDGYNKTCDGQTVTLYPSTLSGVRIYNNVIDSTGWDGMQVGSATEDCEIYNNRVTNYAIDKISMQNVGIQMGAGTTGKCYNNVIQDGNGNGIAIFGNGNIDIYNNLIVNPGKDYWVEDKSRPAHGIFIDNGSTIPGTYFNVFNNTIVSPKTDGIRFQNNISVNNNFYNNIIVNPGSLLDYLRIPAKNPWINLNKANIVLTKSNNLYEVNIDSVHFADYANYNYKLLSTSPAVNAGFDVSSLGINYDLDYNLRPQGNAYDIGAYEYVSDSLSLQNTNSLQLVNKNIPNIENLISGANLIKNNINNKINLQIVNALNLTTDFDIYPNPSNGQFRFKRNNASIINISIYDLMGNIVYRENNIKDFDKEIDISNKLNNGKYFITTNNGSNRTTKTIIINR